MNVQRRDVTNDHVNEDTMAKFFASVYGYMTLGLAISGITAFYTAQSTFMLNLVYGSPFGMIGLFIAELFLVMKLASNGAKLKSAGASLVGFIAFALLNGVTLASIFLIYELGSIGSAFLMTAGTFAGMSLVGFFTKRDMSSFGGQLRGALIGLIIAMVVNGLFLHSGPADFVLSIITVFIFIGFTAYDTHKLKQIYIRFGGQQPLGAVAITGALNLYLDFINIFISLLRIFGDRRS
ncbi:MAG: Bax inhibitor-1/YccA family protein [Carnobacterium sp.]|uniref:Bax inhibitor-1 family protein n=1 Tax=Carnobacterium antarcticum TaxID=2126436 RepID=A0ABW4NQI4_9LACT|nr:MULTISPECIES: Bax inhibitor-1/YccA family protein [unclassified Carnobacterium]ALV22599.1 membrane protein [Carnobacterium sp. CP1]